MRWNRSIALAAALVLCGCEGVGIVATDDPYAKLSQADYLLNEAGRVMQARRQVDEAVPILEQRQDRAGLGQAYRLYGLLALAGGMNDDMVIVRDPKAPLRPTAAELDLSDEYLLRALPLIEEARAFDVAFNINYLLARNQVVRGAPQKSCPYYARAFAFYEKARAEHPDRVPVTNSAGADAGEELRDMQRQAGCTPS